VVGGRRELENVEKQLNIFIYLEWRARLPCFVCKTVKVVQAMLGTFPGSDHFHVIKSLTILDNRIQLERPGKAAARWSNRLPDVIPPT
jgi:hypothetical protein